jgi:DNA-binding XRE family transcriptional regulator
MIYSQETLDLVFGKDSVGDTPEERAKSSKQIWVRSLWQIGHDHEKATGLRLSMRDALEAFGMDALIVMAEEIYCYYGSYVIVPTRPGQGGVPMAIGEPGITLKARREEMGFTEEELAEKAGVTLDALLAVEQDKKEGSIWTVVATCKILGLDPRGIGHKSLPANF